MISGRDLLNSLTKVQYMLNSNMIAYMSLINASYWMIKEFLPAVLNSEYGNVIRNYKVSDIAIFKDRNNEIPSVYGKTLSLYSTELTTNSLYTNMK